MLASEFQVECLRDAGAFEALAAEWNKLLGECPADVPYLTHEWQSIWWRHYGQGRQPYLVTVRDSGGALIGLAPLMLSRRLGLKILEFIGVGWSDYLNFIVKDGAGEVLAAIFEYLTKHSAEWDIIALKDIRFYEGEERCLDESRAALGLLMASRAYTVCPFIPVNSAWEDFVEKSRKLKEYLRQQDKSRRKMERQGPLEFVCLPIPEALPSIYSVEDRSWKKEARTNHFRSVKTKTFFHDIFLSFGTRGWLRPWFLKVNGLPVAYLLSYRYKDKVYLQLEAYDAEYKNSGSVLYGRVIRSAFEDHSVEEVDLLRGASPYKSRWASNHYTTYQVVLFQNGLATRLAVFSLFKLRWQLARWRILHRVLLLAKKYFRSSDSRK